MFSDKFSRVLARHRWVHFCCCVIVICCPLVAEAHETFPGFIKGVEVFALDAMPIHLHGGLQFGYGLQKETVNTFWPIYPVKEKDAEFGENGLTEPVFGFSQSVLLVSSPGEIMLHKNLENDSKGNSDCNALDERSQINAEVEKRNHDLSFWLGIVFGALLGALFAGMTTIPRSARD